ncbi:dihydroorotase [Synergistales bacterium]|nr:dihydroorotase [Synergistales bacterium]
MKILIQNGSLVLPDGVKKGDVLIEGGKIAALLDSGSKVGDAEIVDAKGLLVSPGLIDLHSHLREPGFEYKETIATGTRAAAKGGFTSVCCMANTKPVNDNAAVTELIKLKAKREGVVRVYPIGAATKGLKGEELTEMGELQESGVVAVSDDGRSIVDANRMRLVLTYAAHFNLPVVTHPEDLNLTNNGAMNEGYWSTVLGLSGITRAAEETIIARDCHLAALTGARLHVAHVSTAGGADIVRLYKAKGAKITAETTPHYLYATDDWVDGYDPSTRVNPPLRTKDDVTALIAALKDGTIDCIATDHAPHHFDDKNLEYALASTGISGFETALGVCWTALVAPGHMTGEQLLSKMTSAPAELFSLPGGVIAEGGVADITIIDPSEEWVVDSSLFLSKGKNTPFNGKKLTGNVVRTFVGGERVYERGV